MTEHAIQSAIRIELPWPHKDLSPNARVCWQVKARVTRKARQDAFYAAHEAGADRITGEAFSIATTFHPPTRHAYDQDNLIARCKPIYDGIADALGVDDRHFKHQPVTIAEPVKGGKVIVEIRVIENG